VKLRVEYWSNKTGEIANDLLGYVLDQSGPCSEVRLHVPHAERGREGLWANAYMRPAFAASVSAGEPLGNSPALRKCTECHAHSAARISMCFCVCV
jgi:hypothetical protein